MASYVTVNLDLDAKPEIAILRGADGRSFATIALANFVSVYSPGYDERSVKYLRALAKAARAAADQIEVAIEDRREVSDAEVSTDAADSPAVDSAAAGT